ncbi:MAG: endonuclease/exonuclease/phosphatase family protein [Vicinamibacterales bacterium]
MLEQPEMPTILDVPPTTIAERLLRLGTTLDATVPARVVDRNLLVATWNLRAFGDLTEKWISERADSPKRDLESLLAIREIISRFDVVAIQEVRGNIKALRHLLKVLGPHWGFLLTDVTLGKAGNDERMAFLFDTRRVKASGLAGELVVPPEWIEAGDLDPSALTRQFCRTPYAVSFQAGTETFILVTLHVLYGATSAERRSELGGIARWLADWARREESWGHNLIALGDFNIDRADDANFAAFTSTGLQPPPQLNDVPRTIFASGRESFYDQIAWFTGTHGVPMLSLKYSGKAGCVDFVPIFAGAMTLQELSWRLSDHYPLWVEFVF